MHRIRYEVKTPQRAIYTTDEKTGPEEWVLETEVVSSQPQVIGGALRALADKLDPPGKVTR